jgi:hypothetical protein
MLPIRYTTVGIIIIFAAKFFRIGIKRLFCLLLIIPSSKMLDEINAASSSVWGECLKLKEVGDYAHGYFAPFSGFETWLQKQLSKTQSLHSQSGQAVAQRYCQNYQVFFA